MAAGSGERQLIAALHTEALAHHAQQTHIVAAIPHRHTILCGETGGGQQFLQTDGFILIGAHNIAPLIAVMQKAQPQIAVFFLKAGHRRAGQARKGGERHILQMAVLVFPVAQAGDKAGVQLMPAHFGVFHIDIRAVAVAKAQRVLVVLAVIDQGVHLLLAQPLAIQLGPLAVQHLGPGSADPVIGPDAAQHSLGHLGPAAPRGDDDFDAQLLHRANGLGVFLWDAQLPCRAQRAVNVQNQHSILHLQHFLSLI